MSEGLILLILVIAIVKGDGVKKLKTSLKANDLMSQHVALLLKRDIRRDILY